MNLCVKPWGGAKLVILSSTIFIRNMYLGCGDKIQLAMVRTYLETRSGLSRAKEECRARSEIRLGQGPSVLELDAARGQGHSSVCDKDHISI